MRIGSGLKTTSHSWPLRNSSTRLLESCRFWALPLLLLFILGASGNSTSLPIQSPALVSGVISTPRFRLVYTDRSRGAAQKLAERIESVRAQFQQVLGRDWPGSTEIRFVVGRMELEGLSVPNQKPP